MDLEERKSILSLGKVMDFQRVVGLMRKVGYSSLNYLPLTVRHSLFPIKVPI